jgi:hypothetical protein
MDVNIPSVIRSQLQVALRKIQEDPIEAVTAVIAIANIFLVIAIIVQIRDGRIVSERRLRAFVSVKEFIANPMEDTQTKKIIGWNLG